ncbi:MAG: 2-C-methyl-D-erythritol 4-phosphate cytidylyltransferase [Cytophagales bacterium]|nr:2-C-methyl-D-erythritol 4-phosphate cytidylyltransferase [Cytophagales bacterium]
MDHNDLPQFAVIVAGGSGVRMGGDVPKQFLPVAGLPILMHTLRRFHDYSPALSIILVLPGKDVPYWEALCRQYAFSVPATVVTGGNTRFGSVRNGLAAIAAREGLVAIHDGVRPLVPLTTIAESFRVAAEKGCAVAAVALKDSIRVVRADGGNQALDRSAYRLVQTPQTFRLSVIRRSFAQPEQSGFTDDASVAESAGFPITLIEGAYANIKITTPEDLQWAATQLRQADTDYPVK